MFPPYENSVKVSTAVGIMLTLFIHLHESEVFKTLLLAGFGGASSYVCTLCVKLIIQLIKKIFVRKR